MVHIIVILHTKGVFPSTLLAPSSSHALLGTHWFQVYTAPPIRVLIIEKWRKKIVYFERQNENEGNWMNLIECIALKETFVTKFFVASYLVWLLLFLNDSHLCLWNSLNILFISWNSLNICYVNKGPKRLFIDISASILYVILSFWSDEIMNVNGS